jgi:hypothetical protein
LNLEAEGEHEEGIALLLFRGDGWLRAGELKDRRVEPGMRLGREKVAGTDEIRGPPFREESAPSRSPILKEAKPFLPFPERPDGFP